MIPLGSQWSLTFEVRKRALGKSGLTGVNVSQWSLTFEVRKSATAAGGVSFDVIRSQWSLTFEVRKRRPSHQAGPSSTPRRNGA